MVRECEGTRWVPGLVWLMPTDSAFPTHLSFILKDSRYRSSLKAPAAGSLWPAAPRGNLPSALRKEKAPLYHQIAQGPVGHSCLGSRPHRHAGFEGVRRESGGCQQRSSHSGQEGPTCVSAPCNGSSFIYTAP